MFYATIKHTSFCDIIGRALFRTRSGGMIMNDNEIFHNRIDHIVETILNDYATGRDIDAMDVFHQPENDQIVDIIRKLMIIFFPGYYRDRVYRSYNDRNRLSVHIEDVIYNLKKQLKLAIPYRPGFDSSHERYVEMEAEEAWKAAKFYDSRTRTRRSAINAFERFLKDYPASRHADEARARVESLKEGVQQ